MLNDVYCVLGGFVSTGLADMCTVHRNGDCVVTLRYLGTSRGGSLQLKEDSNSVCVCARIGVVESTVRFPQEDNFMYWLTSKSRVDFQEPQETVKAEIEVRAEFAPRIKVLFDTFQPRKHSFPLCFSTLFWGAWEWGIENGVANRMHPNPVGGRCATPPPRDVPQFAPTSGSVASPLRICPSWCS